MPEIDEPRAEERAPRPAFFAWTAHAFTATGAVIAFLALMAVERGEFRLALAWLVAALVVDGVDGSYARWADVKSGAPRIDGETLDLIIDYLTYVFVPAVFLWRAELIPAGAAPVLAAAILVSALYNFTRRDLKTADNYFRGFPALWHVVALYLFVARPGPGAGALVVGAFALMTFAPVHFVHPFRVRDYGPWLPALATLWAAATALLLWPGWGDGMLGLLLGVSLALGAVLLALGLLRTVRGPRPG
ncbi:MAG TPA: CDP-alcohol phosphatidyltransferase family protein [Allosphingosinicella sp.]|nr:CDP-alcohol phosphatidyltransferase family protein [Allosphingosinicella sp.]